MTHSNNPCVLAYRTLYTIRERSHESHSRFVRFAEPPLPAALRERGHHRAEHRALRPAIRHFDNRWIGSAPCMPARRDMLMERLNFLKCGWGGIEPFDVPFLHLLRTMAASSATWRSITTTTSTSAARITICRSTRGATTAGRSSTPTSRASARRGARASGQTVGVECEEPDRFREYCRLPHAAHLRAHGAYNR